MRIGQECVDMVKNQDLRAGKHRAYIHLRAPVRRGTSHQHGACPDNDLFRARVVGHVNHNDFRCPPQAAQLWQQASQTLRVVPRRNDDADSQEVLLGDC
jgi:hypothetical protein